MNNALIKIKNLDDELDFNKIIKPQNLLNSLNESKKIGKNLQFKINENGKFIIKKKYDISTFSFLVKNAERFTENELAYLTKYMETYSRNDIIILYSIELILFLKLFKERNITTEELYFYFKKLDYIPEKTFNYLSFKLKKKKKIKKQGFKKNTNILQTNKNSYEFPRDYKTLKQQKIKSLLQYLELPLVELPKYKDNQNVIFFLKTIIQIKEELNLKKFNFSLRIKKIRMKKHGMYIINTNSIIIDPRHPDVFIHELGHYIYENSLAFTFNNKRYYPSLFKHEIKKFKKQNKFKIEKSNLETHTDESEIFSIWFEQKVKEKFIL